MPAPGVAALLPPQVPPGDRQAGSPSACVDALSREDEEQLELAVAADAGRTAAGVGDLEVVEVDRDGAVGLDGGAVAAGGELEGHLVGDAAQREVAR